MVQMNVNSYIVTQENALENKVRSSQSSKVYNLCTQTKIRIMLRILVLRLNGKAANSHGFFIFQTHII